jgi:C-3',4' desaturase CrtD
VETTPFYDVAVIGSGIAGLTAAALLQHDGLKVLLLEAHDKPGGCAGYFRAGEFQFPVGATVALGLEGGGLHRRVFDYLGVRDYQTQLLAGLKVLLPDHGITFWHEPEKWQRERSKLPGWGIRHERFWKLQETLADAGWQMLSRLPSLPLQTTQDLWHNLRLLHPTLAAIVPALPLTVGQALHILRLQHDRELLALINLLLIITVQNEAARAPLINGCSGIDLFRHGAFHLRGGMGEIARLLANSFQFDGGTLQFNNKVLGVRQTDDGFQLQTANDEFYATRVIANLPLQNLPLLLDSPVLQSNVQKHLQRSDEQWGAVNLYCAVREEIVPTNATQHMQVLASYAARPGDGRDVFLSLSLHDDTLQAPTGWRALNVSTHTRLSDWENLSAVQYREQKSAWREKMLQAVRRALPNFDEGRKFVIVATPQSWHDYTSRHRGGVGGAPLTLRNANLFAAPQRLGIKNFWAVGDTTFPGQGTVACALSGINAWRDITGQSTL